MLHLKPLKLVLFVSLSVLMLLLEVLIFKVSVQCSVVYCTVILTIYTTTTTTTGLPYMINMTLPDEAENYIHRVGRVGRADTMGLAISIVASGGVKEKVN